MTSDSRESEGPTMTDRALYELRNLMLSAADGVANTMADFTSGEIIREHMEEQRATIERLEGKRDEARDTLKQVRSNMEARMVHDFDYDAGEYPVTTDTIQTLLLEKSALKRERDSYCKSANELAERIMVAENDNAALRARCEEQARIIGELTERNRAQAQALEVLYRGEQVPERELPAAPAPVPQGDVQNAADRRDGACE